VALPSDSVAFSGNLVPFAKSKSAKLAVVLVVASVVVEDVDKDVVVVVPAVE
jgi:hypothetical protein